MACRQIMQNSDFLGAVWLLQSLKMGTEMKSKMQGDTDTLLRRLRGLDMRDFGA